VDWLLRVSGDDDPPKVLSISYGMGEHYVTIQEATAFDVEARKLGLQGVTILVASGDSGVSGDDEDGRTVCGYHPGKSSYSS
jgi:subtilase family serine protease